MTPKQKAKKLVKQYGIETAHIVVQQILETLVYFPEKDHFGFNWKKFYLKVRDEELPNIKIKI